METNKNHPEKGFYYHYKHDPAGSVNNHAYEVMGVGHHTEDDCRPIDQHMVVYRPIYEAFVYKNGKMFDIRPLEMFTEKNFLDSKGNIVPERFMKITDKKVIAELTKIRDEMYP